MQQSSPSTFGKTEDGEISDNDDENAIEVDEEESCETTFDAFETDETELNQTGSANNKLSHEKGQNLRKLLRINRDVAQKRNAIRAGCPILDAHFGNDPRSIYNTTKHRGKVCTLKHDFGFVSVPGLPDAIFHLDKLKAANFKIMIGDILEFDLGGKRSTKTINPTLIRCVSRDNDTIGEYLQHVLKFLSSSRSVPQKSNLTMELLGCKAIAQAIGECKFMPHSTVSIILKLFFRLKQHVSMNSEHFRLFLSELAQTTFLKGKKSTIAHFIDNSLQDTLSEDLKKAKTFLKILVRTLPQYGALVARLIKPLVSKEKSTTENYVYQLFYQVTRLGGEDVCEKAWNELPLIPSNSELLVDGCTEPFGTLSPVNVKGPYCSFDEYIDTYFRLLRADCFDAIRVGVDKLMHGKLDLRDMNVYDQVSLEGILPSKTEAGIQLALKVTPRRAVHNWKTSSNLKFGNLLCLTASGTFTDAIWATVAIRDEALLNAQGIIIVELCFEETANNAGCIANLVKASGSFLMVESPTYYKAYQPVLRALQFMEQEALPFQEELIYGICPEKPPAYITEFLSRKRPLFRSWDFESSDGTTARCSISKSTHVDSEKKDDHGKVEIATEGTMRENGERENNQILDAVSTDGSQSKGLTYRHLPDNATDIAESTIEDGTISTNVQEGIPSDNSLAAEEAGPDLDKLPGEKVERLEGGNIDIASFIEDLVKTIAENGTVLDDSQIDAIKLALTKRVAVIQGPPGTGKTFIGVQLVKLIRKVLKSPILVLTYKNHALDEFLKEMVRIYPDGVIRVGGRSTEPELEQYNLNSIRRRKHKNIYFEEVRKLQKQIGVVIQKLNDASVFSHELLFEAFDSTKLQRLLTSCKCLQVGKREAKTRSLVDQLESRFEQLCNEKNKDPECTYLRILIRKAIDLWIPPMRIFQDLEKSTRSPQLFSKLGAAEMMKNQNEDEDTEYGYMDEQRERVLSTVPGSRGYSKENIVWIDRSTSMDKPGLLDPASTILNNIPNNFLEMFEDPWQLDAHDRAKLIQFLLFHKMKEIEKELEELLEKHRSLHRQREEIEDQYKLEQVMDKEVIGMTVTGANIHKQLLSQIKPAVVIVEEAAEVLEPQLIAVLGEWVQHLILIGDHNQLPPPVECYTLARNYHFDISMMERLINNKCKNVTLLKQNRMRPEFAQLLKDIYPKLQSNLPKVIKNLPPECMVKSMLFWTHHNHESNGRSVTNVKEAEMVVKLALFLIQQQYKPRQITILAAYQGQTSLLKRLVRQMESTHPYLFTDETKRQEGDDDENGRRRIVVHTIDFYQGDENEVVIVSLVRSNNSGQCGFLKELNRRCVSQSRAKCGLYFVGNAETLRRNRHWNKMIQQMEKQGCVGNSIELCCPQHRNISIVRAEIADQIPIGNKGQFCNTPCGRLMVCQTHLCQRKCRPPHSHDHCSVQVHFYYPNCQHPGSKKCHEDPMKKKCEKRIYFKNECGHPAERFCFDNRKIKCTIQCQRMLKCKGKHPCPGQCGDLCDHKNCPECTKIAKAEAAKQRKVEEEARERVQKETKKKIRNLQKAPTSTWYIREDLPDTGDTASEHFDVKDEVMKCIQPGQNWYPCVRSVEKITNVSLEHEWLKSKMNRWDPTRTTYKCYGCSTEDVDELCRNGLLKENGQHGHGIYFASKIMADPRERDDHCVLLCEVLVGKVKTVTGSPQNTTLQELGRKQYDSMFDQRRDENDYDIVAVFDRNQVMPRYVVYYKSCSFGTTGDVGKLERNATEFQDYHITPKREIAFDDPLENHFRLAESQFNRMAQRQYKVLSVDFYVNPPLSDKFNKRQAQLEAKYGLGSPESKYILGFHGTDPNNFDAIVKTNFDMSKVKTCAFGLGIYFSEFPHVSIGYAGGAKKFLLCKILPGKSFDVAGNWDMKPLNPSFDSHRVNKNIQGWAIVIDNPDQILPCYIITYG